MSHSSAAILPSRRAFSIMELLVVISIMGLVVAAAIPALSLMQSTSVTASGVNTISVAAEAARQLATGSKAQKDPLSDGGSTTGAAILVTNTGTIRIVENKGLQTGLTGEQNGFADISGRDYISIPSRVALIGITRNGSGATDLRLVAPPFAVRFNEQGNLIYGDLGAANGFYDVFYNKDYDTNYDTDDRTSMATYDPDASGNQTWNATAGKYELPFGRIDTVVGVLVVDRQDVTNLAADSNGYITSGTVFDTIVENGVPVFFNRYTGAPVSR